MTSLPVVRPVRTTIALVLVLLGMGAVSAAAAPAASCRGSGSPSPNVGSGDNSLLGVAATSTCNAWAVGYYMSAAVEKTLIEHWNGKAWKVQKSPDPSTSSYNELYSVAADSPSDAWAVGEYKQGSVYKALLEHWNGKSWKVQKIPTPSTGDNELFGVAATSPSDAWAVGEYEKGSVSKALVEHWNGKQWKVQKSPDVAGSQNILDAVSARSSSDAWAVGFDETSSAPQTLIEHWNGKTWKIQKSSNPSSFDALDGVAALSAKAALAVGGIGFGNQTLVERSDGKGWKTQASPNPSPDYDDLLGVAAVSPSDAWAVGYMGNPDQPLIEHWNGKAWAVQKTPSPSTGQTQLSGVAALSRSDAWAVGYYYDGVADRTLIERWNGKAWETKAPADELDQEQTDTSGGLSVISSTDSWAQTFTAGRSGLLDRVKLYLEASSSAGETEPVTVELTTTSGGSPTSTVLASSTIPAASVSASGGWAQAKFSPAPPVSAGTQYAIVAYSSSTYYWIEAPTNDYAGGGPFLSNSSPPSSWQPYSTGDDQAFKTYVIPGG